jgi:hypothetical protein
MGCYSCDGCSVSTMCCDELQGSGCDHEGSKITAKAVSLAATRFAGNVGGEEENEKEKEEEEEEEDEEEEATETLEAEKMTKTRGEINENYFENQDRILATRWLEQCKSASLKHTLASWLEESIRSKAVDKGTLGIPKRSNCIAMPESNKKLKASGRTASNPIELA